MAASGRERALHLRPASFGEVDDALVVARKNHTVVANTSKVIRDLAATGARVVGTVVNEY